MYLSEDYVGPELEKPYTTIVLAVTDSNLMQRYMDYIHEQDAGCLVLCATSLDSVDAFYRALLPENLTFVIADSIANDVSDSNENSHESTVEARIKSAIEQGSLVRMVRIKDMPSFEQSMNDAIDSNRVFSHFTMHHKPRLVAVA